MVRVILRGKEWRKIRGQGGMDAGGGQASMPDRTSPYGE